MIRRRLAADEIAAAAGTLDASRTLTDVVGTVVEVADDGDSDATAHDVAIETKRGLERVPMRDIVAVKELGPRPVRRGAPHRAVSAVDLEELMVAGWMPHEHAWMGRWMLRAAGGYTGRANSCLLLGEPDRAIPDALAAVIGWYAERGLPPLLQVALAPGFDAEEDDLVQEAAALGWEPYLPVRVMTASAAVVAQAGSPAGAPTAVGASVTVDESVTIDVEDDITDAWWALADDRTRAHESAARRVFTGSTRQRFLIASDDDSPIGHARLALSPGWGGIFVLATHPDARRRGVGRGLVAACAREAVAAGAASLYLQVAADNDAAIALYESMGFTTHHTYVYLRPVV